MMQAGARAEASLSARLLTTTLLATGILSVAVQPALAQSLPSGVSRVVDGSVLEDQTVSLNGNGQSGFEVMNGVVTVDAEGESFSNFNTQGGDGSGGGAGLGGVFFVNEGATLVIRDANFTNNRAVGGDGGGGGSVEVRNAALGIVDKEATTSTNLVSGYTYDIVQDGSSFSLTRVTYDENDPVFEVRDGVIFGAATAGSGGAVTTSSNATVTGADETGFSFDGGLDVSDSISSSMIFTSDSWIAGTAGAMYFYEDSQVRIGTENLSVSDRGALQTGLQIVGDGVPEGTYIESVVKDGDGNVTEIILNQAVDPDAMGGSFNIFSPPLLIGSVFAQNSADTLDFGAGNVPPSYEVGMRISGEGISGDVTIESINRSTGVVTLSDDVPSELLSLSALKPGFVEGSNEIYLPTTNHGLSVGDTVYGAGIPAGTTVVSIDGDRVILSQNISGEMDVLYSSNVTVSGTTVTVNSGVDGVKVGQIVEGDGVPAGTVVTAVDPVTGSVTLSSAISGTPGSLRFVSESAMGGGMNGREVSGNVAVAAGGPDGSLPLDGEGVDGRDGLHAADSTTGFGGIGGSGGSGSDGLATNPMLVADIAATGAAIAAAVADAVASSMPDPYPDPSNSASSTANAISLGITLAAQTTQLVNWQIASSEGTLGTGGDGGDGGDGGNGGDFFGGGSGGAGGSAGTSAGNPTFGSGNGGSGGSGGNGGFGAGGGGGGQPANAAQSAAGSGGYGGFGGGDGSTVNSSGETMFGSGGAGFGGAIFVRSGGSVTLQGEMTFAGNSTRGGSSGDLDGSSGDAAGADMFIMKGAQVTISADEGKEIIFEGGIADDSKASYEGAQFADGDGADVTINGMGRVLFLGENTYSGTTHLDAGTLVAEDGVGLYANSLLEFGGLDTDAMTSDSFEDASAAVFQTAGEFTRWVGMSSDNVMWTGSGGFAAETEEGLVLNFGASSLGSPTLVWGQGGFVPDGSSLILGSVSAEGTVTLVNDIRHGDPDGAVSFYLIDNANSQADGAILQGDITADRVNFDAKSVLATAEIQGSIIADDLYVRGGHLTTTGTGTLDNDLNLRVSEGAAFTAERADTFGSLRNAGTSNLDALVTVDLVDNEGTLNVNKKLTVTDDAVNRDGGVVNMDAEIDVTNQFLNNGTLNVNGERTLTAGTFDGDTTGRVVMAEADDKFTADLSGSSAFAGQMSGLGSFVKEGEGQLSLYGANSYTGGTTVADGTLVIGSSGGNVGSLADTGAIGVLTGATLTFDVSDTVGVVTNGGILNTNDDLTVASLDNESSGVFNMRANLTSTGNVNNDGTVNVEGSRRIETTGDTSGLTGAGTINLTLAAADLTVDQLGDTTFAGNITGAGSFNKEGTGVLTFTGAHSYTGGTVVREGTLDTTGGGTLADTGYIGIAEGATFIAGTVDTVGGVENRGTYTVNAVQTVDALMNFGTTNLEAKLTAGVELFDPLDPDSLSYGVINLSDGTINQNADIESEGMVFNSGLIEVTGERRIDITGADQGLIGVGTGEIRLSGADTELTVDQLGDTTYDGIITGLGGFTKEGSGTLSFSNALTFTGGTTVSEGWVEVQSTGSLADTGAITVGENGSFITRAVDTVGEVRNSGTYIVASDAAQNVTSFTNTGTGEAEIWSNLTARTGGVTNQLNGVFDINADIYSFGDVTNDGELNVNGVRRIETTGASSGFAGASTGVVNLELEGDILTVDQLGDTTYAGVINGLGAFIKEGTGTLTFTGASTYTGGTLVSEGTLDTTGGGTLADTGAIEISQGATFVAGTADTVGGVLNNGTYNVNAAQNVDALVNNDTTNLEAKLTAGVTDTGFGVANNDGATFNQNADIESEGNVINNGLLEVTGGRRIDITGTGDDAGFQGNATGEVRLSDAEGSLTVDQLGDTLYAGIITGEGAFAKEGEGELHLSGANTFTGGTTVREGWLVITEDGSLADTGEITIEADGTFATWAVDTVGVVTNKGTYYAYPDAAQNVTSFTNSGTAEIWSVMTARTGGVTNEETGEFTLNANVFSEGDFTNDGTLDINGYRRIEMTGADSGFAGAGTGVVHMDAATDYLVVDQAGDTTYAGTMDGLGIFVKEGDGTLTFTGAHSYTGGTLVSEGTLDTTGGGTLADTGDLEISSGATFVAGTADTVRDVVNHGTYDVNTAQTVASLYSDGTTDLDAALTAGEGGVYNDEDGTFEQNANVTSEGYVTNSGLWAVTGTRRIDVTGADAGFEGGATGEVQLAGEDDKLIVDQLGTTQYAGIITGAGAFEKEGDGTLYLTGASTFTGGTTVREGVLSTTGGGTLADTGAIDILSGATFYAGTADTVGDVTNKGTFTFAADYEVASLVNSGQVSGTGVLTAGAEGIENQDTGTIKLYNDVVSQGDVQNDGEIEVVSSSLIEITGEDAGLTGSGNFTLADGGELGIDQQGDSSFDGTMTGEGTFWKYGEGQLTFGGAYGDIDVPTLRIVEGGLTLAMGGVLRSDADVYLTETTFEITEGAQTLNSLNGEGTVALNGSDLTLDGEGTFQGDIQEAGALTLNDSFNYAGIMGGDSLTLNGPDFTLYSLSEANFRTADFTNGLITLYGPVDAGGLGGLTLDEDLTVTGDTQLVLAGAIDPDRAVITADSVTLSGADVVLSGNGYVDAANIVVENGAFLSPGNSPGYLSFAGNLDLRNGGGAQIEIGGTEPGTGYDVIEVGGELLLDETSVLNVDPFGGFEPQQGEVYQILRFDPQLRTGDFGNFTNNTSLNFAYFNSVGILVALGDSGGDVSEQLVENILETTPEGEVGSKQMFDVVRQLGDPEEGLVGENNGVVGGGGGYLLPMLAAADPEDRVEIFSRFTPEGYGGAHEYAFRSLMVTSGLFADAPLSGNLSWGSLVHDNRSLASQDSDTYSDYETSFANTGARFGYTSDMVAVGLGVQTVNGGFSTEAGLSGDGDGTQFQIGAMLTGMDIGLAPYITLESGSSDLSGTRNALTSRVEFDGVESSARLVRIGARYSNKLGAGVLNIDTSVMTGEVDGLSFSETQGVMPDRLDVQIPGQSVAGISLGMNYSYPVAPKVTVSAGLEIDHVEGLNDYVVEGRSGGDEVTFTTEVPGMASTQGALSLGVGFEATEAVRVNLTGFADGSLGGKSKAGASLSLNVQF
ncbi:hypothetical protein CVM39_09365 [Pseudooceanicola antarcticus]|nr:hypothetical protein CVM39_09365 [Pseudooceanicola antarcticus]